MQIGDLQHKGIRTESAAASFYLDASITGFADVGKPVSVTGDFTVGFGAADDEILGYLESYENREVEGVKMGAVSWHMCAEFDFVAWYRKSPIEAYGHSPFVSAINTMAARQQVINDLYRIMQVTGFPRIAIKVLEEVLVKNAPADVKVDPQKLRTYISQRRQDIGSAFASLRPDQAMVHTDSAEVSMLNEKNPATGIKIQEVIDTLNAQNQAGLKTMATVLGRGESGVNTATVEANLFAKAADSLNEPIGEILGSMLTMALRMQGSESRVIVRFPNIDLRSELELEAQLNLKSNRLRTDLSDGLITDDDYHIAMYRRIRPDSVAELSGTGFIGGAMEVEAEKVSPNSDPQGRSVSRASDKSAKSNANQS